MPNGDLLAVWKKVNEIMEKGCAHRANDSAIVKENARRIAELESKLWWIIVLLVSNLAVVIVNLLTKLQ